MDFTLPALRYKAFVMTDGGEVGTEQPLNV